MSGEPAPPEATRRPPRRIERALLLSVALGGAVYVAYAAFSGWRSVAARLEAFAWWTAAAGAGLAALNYLIRFLRWQYYLRRLDLDVPRGRSLLVFLAGFALTVTPGKVGEVLKSYLLRESDGIPMARTAPIVVAERVTDLVALLVLALAGGSALASSPRLRITLYVGAALVAALVAGVASATVADLAIGLVARLPVVGRLAPKLREFHRAARALLGPGPLLVGTLLGAAAWACECVAFWLILGGFPGASAGVTLCTFIYAVMTVAGALSFLPGGLGVQEGGMVELLTHAARGVDEPTAFAATFVTRLCTLWFAVLVGVIALAWVRRSGVTVDLSAVRAAREPAD